jgi:hypothetical protein
VVKSTFYERYELFLKKNNLIYCENEEICFHDLSSLQFIDDNFIKSVKIVYISDKIIVTWPKEDTTFACNVLDHMFKFNKTYNPLILIINKEEFIEFNIELFEYLVKNNIKKVEFKAQSGGFETINNIRQYVMSLRTVDDDEKSYKDWCDEATRLKLFS